MWCGQDEGRPGEVVSLAGNFRCALGVAVAREAELGAAALGVAGVGPPRVGAEARVREVAEEGIAEGAQASGEDGGKEVTGYRSFHIG